MILRGFVLLAAALTVAGAAVAALSSSARAEGAARAVPCHAPANMVRLQSPLKRVAKKLASSLPLTIVAIGSSSTFGAGASSPDHSYPSRLAAELKSLWPRTAVTVLNRGVNGEEARDMLARFDRDIFAQHPDLVLWQVGSNSVLRGRALAEANAPLHEGLRRLRATSTDVVLINPQYAPKVLAKHDIDSMVELIDRTAKETNVDLFPRFAVMRQWRVSEHIPFSQFVSPDELHMNDWSYACLAKLLAGALDEAATRSTVTAGVKP
jgi:lysophospholipase L1-like esterase